MNEEASRKVQILDKKIGESWEIIKNKDKEILQLRVDCDNFDKKKEAFEKEIQD